MAAAYATFAITIVDEDCNTQNYIEVHEGLRISDVLHLYEMKSGRKVLRNEQAPDDDTNATLKTEQGTDLRHDVLLSDVDVKEGATLKFQNPPYYIWIHGNFIFISKVLNLIM